MVETRENKERLKFYQTDIVFYPEQYIYIFAQALEYSF